MVRSRSVLLALFTLGALAIALPAAAQTKADLSLAKQHFALGRTLYEQGDYEKALGSFRESYRLSKQPALLYNIARCYESLARLKEAIEHYERYLKETGKKDFTVQARIRNLKKRIEATQKPQPRPPESQPQSQPARPEPPKPQPPQPTPSDRPSSWMKWTGWSLVGVGVASIVTGVVLGTRAKAKANLIEDAYEEGLYEWEAMAPTERAGERFEIAQIVTLTVGGAALAGGVALVLFDLLSKRERRAALAPMIGPSFAGLGGRLTF